MLKTRLSALALAILISGPTNAFAWGNEGHEIVARIAQKFLTPPVAQRVDAILADDRIPDMVEAATWLDQVRRARKNTAPWHFTDIDVKTTSYNAQRDCENDACSVAQITAHEESLKRGGLSADDTDEAVKVLLHLVGDLHQPLHNAHRIDANGDSDRGGNEVEVRFLGKLRNLHSVWDTYIIREMMDDAGFTTTGSDDDIEKVEGYADQLASGITPAIQQACQSGNVEQWANDAFRKAKQVAYGKLPKATGTVRGSDRLVPEIGPKYEALAQPIIEEQLRCGGLRLAMVLNDVLQ